MGVNYQFVILLFTGIILCEMHGVIYYLWPQTASIEYDLFLDRNYHQKITVLWYTYELMNILDRIIWAYVLSKIALHISRQLFKTGIVFICYYIVQFLFYIWNRNTSYLANYFLYAAMMIAIIVLLFFPDEMSKLRKID